MTPFEIIRDHESGVSSATDGTRVVTALDPEAKMFRRRGIKGVGSGDAMQIEWLVVEQAGVRVYVSGNGVVVTKQDLMP